MSDPTWDDVLREVTALAGVRGAIVVSADDGLVVAETAMEGVSPEDVAALAGALAMRATRSVEAFGDASPTSVQLVATHGALIAVAGPPPLWLVALAGDGVELGRLRLLLGDLTVAIR